MIYQYLSHNHASDEDIAIIALFFKYTTTHKIGEYVTAANQDHIIM